MIGPQQIDLDKLVTMLEKASVASEPSLQSKWAGLLASMASSPETPRSFIYILEQLEPFEARLLDELFTKPLKHPLPVVVYNRVPVSFGEFKTTFACVVSHF